MKIAVYCPANAPHRVALLSAAGFARGKRFADHRVCHGERQPLADIVAAVAHRVCQPLWEPLAAGVGVHHRLVECLTLGDCICLGYGVRCRLALAVGVVERLVFADGIALRLAVSSRVVERLALGDRLCVADGVILLLTVHLALYNGQHQWKPERVWEPLALAVGVDSCVRLRLFLLVR